MDGIEACLEIVNAMLSERRAVNDLVFLDTP
jgi:hypothetical protein